MLVDPLSQEILQSFGRTIRRVRKSRGLSQEALALEAGVQRNFVSLIERGVNQPSLMTLVKLCNALEMPLSSLISAWEADVQTPTTSLSKY